MPITVCDGAAGAPWERPLAGALDRFVVESELLAGNPLGDPARRPLYVYRPPGVGRAGEEEAPLVYDVPAVYVLQGFTGQVDRWLSRSSFEPTIVERLDALFEDGKAPPAVVVFVDAWTSLGGSQFLNSTATGRYLDYLCDEVVPFVDARYPTLRAAEGRALFGKSSGGYGAMVVPMLRPGLFGALGSIAGDALFEVCCLPEFRRVARILRDRFDGSYEVFLTRFREADHFDYGTFGTPLEMYAYAAAYSPDPGDPARPQLPFDVRTGRLVPEVWERWLQHDPVRMIPRHAEALRGMRRIALSAGRSDEPFLDLAAQAVSDELAAHGIEHTFELFDGGHGGIDYRYPGVIAELVRALAD